MILNKTALVTGAGSKIAEAIIENLELSHQVIKHKLHQKQGYLNCDLSDENQVSALFDDINKFDTLVCCAGGIKGLNEKRPKPDDCINISGDEAYKLFDRNFFSTFFTCKYAIPKMRLQSNIVFIGSAVVSKPREQAEVGMYACAKAAVHEYALHLAKELEGKIRVNCIATDGHDIGLIVKNVNTILNSKMTGQII